MRRLRARRAGLTLIELLVVMMILAILASGVALSVINKVHLAKVNAAKSDVKTIEMAIDLYELTMGEPPTAEQGLMALIAPPGGVDAEKWRQAGPYVKKKNFQDPWGNEYVYECPGANDHPYEILCYGADGRAGGDGKDADFSNWDLTRGDGEG